MLPTLPLGRQGDGTLALVLGYVALVNFCRYLAATPESLRRTRTKKDACPHEPTTEHRNDRTTEMRDSKSGGDTISDKTAQRPQSSTCTRKPREANAERDRAESCEGAAQQRADLEAARTKSIAK